MESISSQNVPPSLRLQTLNTYQADDWEAGHTHAEDQKHRAATDTSKVSFKDRVRHVTWAWFTLTMSTGGLALLLHSTPHRFRGLDVIGKIFFILDLALFILLVSGISARFIMTPRALKLSLTHPTESLFFPCAFLSLATIISNSAAYGIPSCGPWLPVALRVLFWLYTAIVTIAGIAQFSILFAGARLPIPSMTPAWVLPIFPAMLTGTLAAAIAPSQPPDQRMPMLAAGVTYQGLGFSVALLVFPLYLGRLMQDGLPAPAMRPAMFIAVGPAGFTALALIGMARAVPEGYGYFIVYPLAPQVLRIIATWVGVWIWCLGFWFFAISCVAVLAEASRKRVRFSLGWWAFVFPNVGFTVATGYLGQELGSSAVTWVASAMTICIVVMWFVVLIAHIRAVVRKKILFPGRDEDRGEK